MKGAVCKRIYDKVVAENEELQGKANAYADLVMENEKLKRQLNDCVNASYIQLLEQNEEWEEENKKLKKKNEELKDFTNWENHPALKHKVVLDDDYYLGHVEDGELIDPESFSLLKDEKEHLDSLVDDLKKELESLKKSNKQKTKIIRKFREQVKELQERENRMTDIADANGWDIYPTDSDEEEEGYTHGVSIDCEDEEVEELFHSYEEAEKYYYKCVSDRKRQVVAVRRKTKIYFYGVPEEYDGGCESFKDGWIIRATVPDEE